MALTKIDISMLEDIPAPGSTGQVIKSDGTNWTSGADAGVPAAGADGQVLTSDGTNWASEAAAGGGAWTLIKSTTASTSSSMAFAHGTDGVVIDNTYATYVVVGSEIHLSNDNENINFHASTDAGSSWDTSSKYQFHVQKLITDNAAYVCEATYGSGFITMMRWFGNAAGENGSFEFYFSAPSSTTSWKRLQWYASCIITNGKAYGQSGFGFYDNLAAMTGIRFLPTGGTIASGRFTLFGISHT